jgi:Leucine-rich repeat (LRR) protein
MNSSNIYIHNSNSDASLELFVCKPRSYITYSIKTTDDSSPITNKKFPVNIDEIDVSKPENLSVTLYLNNSRAASNYAPLERTIEHSYKIFRNVNDVSIYLNDNILTEVPKFIYTMRQLVLLDLSENHLKTLPQNFTKLTRITNLSLSDNKIKHNIPDVIFKLTTLRILNVSNNLIKSIPDNISSLENLEELNVSNSILEQVSSNILSLSSLTCMSMSIGNLIDWPQQLTQMSQLRLFCDARLDNVKKIEPWARLHEKSNLGHELSLKILLYAQISQERISKVFKCFGDTYQTRLTALKIHANCKSIPLELFSQATQITKLALSGRAQSNPDIKPFANLIDLQISLDNMTNTDFALANLRSMDLYNNNISSLPNLFHCSNLTKLDLNLNKIQNLDDNVLPVNLQVLILSDNALSTLAGISTLQSLKILLVNHNQLQSCPEISNLRSLECLSIHHNKLTSLDVANLSNLSSLNASSNKITIMNTLPQGLTQLNLCHNRLSVLPSHIFQLEFLNFLLLGSNLVRSDDNLFKSF